MNDTMLEKVVLMDARLPKSQRGETLRLSAVLKQCRDLASDRLSLAVPKVMDKLDDALFDLADRSTTNLDRALYFETMREVRLKRAGMEEGFKRHFKEAVRRKVESLGGRDSSSSFMQASSANLGLVDEDDFEEALAVTNMVQKIRGECRQTLYALERRLEHLLGLSELASEHNPLGPEVVCDAFKDACSDLDANVQVRLTILKLFDRHVVPELAETYALINELLVEQGVLPEIRHEVKIPERHHRRAYPPPGALAGDSHPGPGGDATRGPARAQTIPAAPPGPSPFTEPSTDAALADTADSFSRSSIDVDDQSSSLARGARAAPSGTDLLEALSSVMNVNYASAAGRAPGDAQLRAVHDLTRLQHADVQALPEEFGSLDVSGIHTGRINVLRGLKSAPVVDGMGEIDAMMFDVVAMMFDFILDDKGIPAPIKALIGRLQIPVLKVAIIDKSFFARKFHPARKLLNTLAETSLGWSDDEDRNDLLYGKMEMLVMRVLDEFDDRMDIFSEVLSELEAFIEEEELGAVANATAEADAIQGRERLNAARQGARESVQRCLASGPVPALVREFLATHWKELLFVRHFEEGEHGPGYTNAIQSMEELIWSVAPKTLAEDRKHLTNLLPSLLRRLRDGMHQLAVPTELSARFLGELKKLHIAAIRNELPTESEVNDHGSAEHAPDADPLDESTGMTGSQGTMDTMDLEWSDGTNYSVEELTLIQLAIERANEIIHGAAETRPECTGMGTTLVATQFHENRVTVAHVGDSRLYRLRGSSLEQLTTDHSLRQQLVERGLYTPQEAKEKIGNNVVTRALGADDGVEVETRELPVERDDLYLLCSDGLTDMVEDHEIEKLLIDHGADLEATARLLVERANENGGEDNISAVLVRVLDTSSASYSDEAEISDALEMYGITDVGSRRSHNEDHIAVDVRNGIAIVADGMGGCNAGEVASEMAVKVVIEALREGSADVINVTGARFEETVMSAREARLNATTAAAKALLETDSEGIVIESLPRESRFEVEEDDEHTRMIRGLEVGDWVEFRHADGDATRARLTWLSPVTGRYLFTDRKGMKVADSTLHGLATELMRGSLALIDDVPLFDRVIGNITDHLRANQQADAAH